MTAVDWSTVRPRHGDWVCPEHGVVDRPWQQIVPACPDCLRALHRAVETKPGWFEYHEPRPTHCAGSDRHPLRDGQVLLGSKACLCSASGLHRTWTCRCGDTQQWPPHSDVDAAPYFGPG